MTKNLNGFILRLILKNRTYGYSPPLFTTETCRDQSRNLTSRNKVSGRSQHMPEQEEGKKEGRKTAEIQITIRLRA